MNFKIFKLLSSRYVKSVPSMSIAFRIIILSMRKCGSAFYNYYSILYNFEGVRRDAYVAVQYICYIWSSSKCVISFSLFAGVK
jgi:hypothetical protein